MNSHIHNRHNQRGIACVILDTNETVPASSGSGPDRMNFHQAGIGEMYAKKASSGYPVFLLSPREPHMMASVTRAE